MAEILGPTLEQLDNWGSIDDLDAFGSLEDMDNLNLFETTSSVATAITAAHTNSLVIVKELEGSPSLVITTALNGIRIQSVDASVTGAASVAAIAQFIVAMDSSVNIAITESSAAQRVQFVDGSVSISTTATSDVNTIFVISGDADILIDGECAMQFTASGAGSVSCVITSVITGEVLGELWSVVSEGNETWSEVTAGSEVWTNVSEGSEVWYRQ